MTDSNSEIDEISKTAPVKYKDATLVYNVKIGGRKFPWSWYYSDSTVVSSVATKETAMFMIDNETEIREEAVFRKLRR